MKIFKYQQWHFLILVILLIGIFFIVNADNTMLRGDLFGIKSRTWFLVALYSPILHQVYVVICWRLELYYSSISIKLGSKGFDLFKIGFAILILARLVTISILATSSPYTFNGNAIYMYILGGILLLPSAYLFYSVKKYFGMDRAFGIDHFKPEEFRSKTFVKKGIFKYTSNGMYIYGFLILWIPGILFQSKAALLIALFNHIYIWVHYYFTELPDIKVIYEDYKNQ